MRLFLPLLLGGILLPFYALSQAFSPEIKPILWLKDSAGSAKAWMDFSDHTLHTPREQVNRVSQEGGFLNGHLGQYYDGTQQEEFELGLSAYSEISFFAVVEAEDSTLRAIWGSVSGVGKDFYMASQKTLGPDSLVDELPPLQLKGQVLSTLQIWNEPAQTLTGDKLILGGAGRGLEKFRGYVYEFLVFNRKLSFLEKVQIETYLALKYGLTLRESNYVSSHNQLLWDHKKEKSYSNKVLGIGRSDVFGLYQVQSGHPGREDEVIGIAINSWSGEYAPNGRNLENNQYLVWGHNDGAFELEDESSEENDQLPIVNRKWKMRATGDQSQLILTEMVLHRKYIETGKEPYWLAIDRSGGDAFSLDNMELIQPVQRDSFLVYSNLKWDQDASGLDAFSFFEPKDFYCFAEVKYHPYCYEPDAGIVELRPMGGTPPFRYELTAPSLNYKNEFQVRDTRTVMVEGLIPGNYQLVARDSKNKEIMRVFQVRFTDGLIVDLGIDRSLKEESEIWLDASTHISEDEEVSYFWENGYGFSSNEAKIRVEESGVYKVTVTRNDGCEFTDEVTVSGASALKYNVYPNLLGRNQDFNVAISLDEPGGVSIQIMDMGGKLQQTLQGTGQSEYKFTTSLPQSGMYVVVLKTSDGLESRKLIIQ